MIFMSLAGMSLFQKVKLAITGALILAAIAAVLYVRHVFQDRERLRTEVVRLEKELEVANRNILALKDTNAKLASQLTVQEEQYRKVTEELLKLSRRPPRVIEIPKVIEKPVPVETEECQRMGVMIDEYLEIMRGVN